MHYQHCNKHNQYMMQKLAEATIPTTVHDGVIAMVSAASELQQRGRTAARDGMVIVDAVVVDTVPMNDPEQENHSPRAPKRARGERRRPLGDSASSDSCTDSRSRGTSSSDSRSLSSIALGQPSRASANNTEMVVVVSRDGCTIMVGDDCDGPGGRIVRTLTLIHAVRSPVDPPV